MKSLLVLAVICLMFLLSGCITPTYTKTCTVIDMTVPCDDIKTTVQVGVKY